MKTWKFSSQDMTGTERESRWQDAVRQIVLPATTLDDHDGFHGDLVSVVSPTGIELSRVASSAQTISGACFSETPFLWLALPIEGEFLLDPDDESVRLRPGDALYGPTGCAGTLTLPEDFVMMYLRIPQPVLHPRLVNVPRLSIGMLTASTPANRIFTGLLKAIVEDLEGLTPDNVRPVEVAISEFIVANLAESAGQSCFNTIGAGNFHRICQAIEAQLADGNLSLTILADQQQMSTRYIQKLFQQADMSFVDYLKKRRLDHCRADLASPSHRHLSIGEISQRWGFNDAAHFSRCFSADCGMTPRQYRNQHLA